MLITSN